MNNLPAIQRQLSSKEVTNRVALALNLDPNDEKAHNKAAKYASSVLAEVQKTVGDPKRDLSVCKPESIVQAMIDAAQFQIAIDGRQHAHLVKFGQVVQLQIGFRGFLAKIKEHYPDAEFLVEPIFEGDEVKIWMENGTASYSLKKASAFSDDLTKFKGILFAVSYTSGSRMVQKVVDVPKSRIDRARKAAKQDFIWSSDYIEKAKAAAIKVACKQMFASIQGLQEIAEYDNTTNFNPNQEQEASVARKSIIDNINEEIAHPEKEEAPDITDLEELVDVDGIIEAGNVAASKGMEAFKAWANGLDITDQEREALAPYKSGWVEKAKLADTNNDEGDIPL